MIITGLSDKEALYTNAAKVRWKAIQAVMWNEEDGCWYDYDLEKKEQRKRFYPSNVFPLTSYGDTKVTVEVAEKVVTYLEVRGAPFNFLGGELNWRINKYVHKFVLANH